MISGVCAIGVAVSIINLMFEKSHSSNHEIRDVIIWLFVGLFCALLPVFLRIAGMQ